MRDAGASQRSFPDGNDEIAQTGGDHFEGQSSVEVVNEQREPRRHLRARNTRRLTEKLGRHVGQDDVEGALAVSLGLDGQCTGGQLQHPACVNVVAAVLMMKDGRRAENWVPREVELFEQVEDACAPMELRPGLVEKYGLELAQFPRDLSHLRGAQPARVGEDAQAVAAIGRRGEYIDELELHRNDATRCATIDGDDADRQPRPFAVVVGHRNRIVHAACLCACR